MTLEVVTQIQSLRRRAFMNRGVALLSLEAGDVLEAADLHQEAIRDEAAADELERSQKVLAAH